MLLNRLLFSQRRPRLRAYLLGLVAVALIPAFGIAAGAAYVMHRDLQRSFEARLTAMADAAAVAVDRQIETRRAVLDAIAADVTLDALSGDGPRDPEWVQQRLLVFYGLARRVAERTGDPLALFRPDGRVVFRTNMPFGSEAAPLRATEELRRVVASRTPVVGNLYPEPRLLVPLLVPVIRDGEVVAVLGSGISVSFLSGVLDAVQLAGVEFTSVLDGNGRVLAVTPEGQNSLAVGQRVRDWQQRAALEHPTGGMARGTSLTGVPVVAALHPIPTTPGWMVTVAARVSTYSGLQRQPLFWLLLGGVAVFLLSLAAALYLSQRLVRPVVALTRQAEEQASGSQHRRTGIADIAAIPVAEIERLHGALVRADEVQLLLAREVDHRAKNLLAVVQAVMRMSRADSKEEFVAAVCERVNALARVHSLLAQEGWEGIGLLALAERELAAHADRVTLHGPSVSLASTAAQPMSMLLHELSTNSVKYGALSTPEGRVKVSWSLEPAESRLHLCWRESDGPAVAQRPPRQGFGTRVIDTSVAQLGGTVQRHWQPSGLLCKVRLPLERTIRHAGPERGQTSTGQSAHEDELLEQRVLPPEDAAARAVRG